MSTRNDDQKIIAEPIGHRGLIAAGAIIGGWGLSLSCLLTVDIGVLHPILIGLLVALQTFLHTGLFITAHDAMHGTVYPASHRINDAIGTLATTLYALFSYRTLHEKHWEHHGQPGTDNDPDYHDEQAFWPWYVSFLIEYAGGRQILGMAVVYNIAHHLLGIAIWNLNVFWVAPALLSTLQLFYFGTYLPHREPEKGHVDEHHTTSNQFHPIVSFLTCYHFGYHWEHHERPDCPWWRLPRLRRTLLNPTRSERDRP